jgi:hypothetical protein
MATSLPRVTITMDEELYGKVKDYQFNNRINNQTAAILKLINLGLVSAGLMDEVKERRSKKENELIAMYAAAPKHIQRLVDFAIDPKQTDAESQYLRDQIDLEKKDTKKEPGQ